MYVKITNGVLEKYNLGKLRRDNPKTSFPKVISEETLGEHSIYPYTVEEETYLPLTQNLVEGDFYQDSENNWVLPLVAENMHEETASQNVRHKRNNLLAETDWVVTFYTERGENVPENWKSYRQALRDIVQNFNFPFLQDEDWPTKP